MKKMILTTVLICGVSTPARIAVSNPLSNNLAACAEPISQNRKGVL